MIEDWDTLTAIVGPALGQQDTNLLRLVAQLPPRNLLPSWECSSATFSVCPENWGYALPRSMALCQIL
jgi:hypothetical protein